MVATPDAFGHAVRNLLAGHAPNGITPADCGDRATTLQQLNDAHNAGGTDQVKKTFSALARKDPTLAAVIAGDTPAAPAPARVDCPVLPAAARLPADLGTDACPWLDDYIAFSRQWSPRSYDDFHEAVALWLLSTIAARRVRLAYGKVGNARRYTNLYIALCARSSLFSKSTAVNIAIAVLHACSLHTLLTPDEATPQAFIRALSARVPDGWAEMPADKRDSERQRLGFVAQRGWFYDELGMKISSMMRDGGAMADFRGLLKKFDDCPEQYEYLTINRGSDTIDAPYLALLGSLTPADIKPYARPGGALWGDGFYARFAFVTPPADAPPARGRFPLTENSIPAHLTQPLRTWHRRLGMPRVDIVDSSEDGEKPQYTLTITPAPGQECTLSADVIEAFYAYHDGLLDITAASDNQDLDGNYARFADKALRIATLLASVSNNGAIEIRHWARAQQITERWRRSLHNLIGQVQDSEPTAQATNEDKVYRVLKRSSEPLTAREIVLAIRGLGTGEVADILAHLVKAGDVIEMQGKRTKRYTLSEV